MKQIKLNNVDRSGFDIENIDPFENRFMSLVKRYESSNVPIGCLVPYTDEEGKPQHYLAYNQEKLNELAESIKSVGILNPITVRKHGEKYQILSGHNRYEAAKIAGLTHVPVSIVEADDNMAGYILNSSNLIQRDLTPMERARGYYDAREFLRKYNEAHNTKYKMPQSTPDVERMVERYMRLNKLIQPLQDDIEKNVISANSGYELSFLSEDNQESFKNYIENHPVKKVSIQQAASIRSMAEAKADKLSDDDFNYTFNYVVPDKENNDACILKNFYKQIKQMIPKDITEIESKEILAYIRKRLEIR